VWAPLRLQDSPESVRTLFQNNLFFETGHLSVPGLQAYAWKGDSPMRISSIFVMVVALVSLAGCSRTVGDLNPYTNGTALGNQKVSPWTTSVASEYVPAGMDANGVVQWRPAGIRQHDRPFISGLAEGSEVFANVAFPVAALKIAFDPPTQKYRIDERGQYQVSSNVSGTVQNEHIHSGSIGHNHEHSGTVNHNVEGWIGHHHWQYWGNCND